MLSALCPTERGAVEIGGFSLNRTSQAKLYFLQFAVEYMRTFIERLKALINLVEAPCYCFVIIAAASDKWSCSYLATVNGAQRCIEKASSYTGSS